MDHIIRLFVSGSKDFQSSTCRCASARARSHPYKHTKHFNNITWLCQLIYYSIFLAKYFVWPGAIINHFGQTLFVYDLLGGIYKFVHHAIAFRQNDKLASYKITPFVSFFFSLHEMKFQRIYFLARVTLCYVVQMLAKIFTFTGLTAKM